MFEDELHNRAQAKYIFCWSMQLKIHLFFYIWVYIFISKDCFISNETILFNIGAHVQAWSNKKWSVTLNQIRLPKMVIHIFFSFFFKCQQHDRGTLKQYTLTFAWAQGISPFMFSFVYCTARPIFLTFEFLWESKSVMIILQGHVVYLVAIHMVEKKKRNACTTKWMTRMAMRMIYHDMHKGRQFEAGLLSEGHVRCKTRKWRRLCCITWWQGPAIGQAV